MYFCISKIVKDKKEKNKKNNRTEGEGIKL